jgi:hypothetical protein
MDRRKFVRGVVGSLLATPVIGWSGAPYGAVRAKAATPSLASLAANTARALGPYANPAREFNTAGLSAASITDFSGIVYDPIGKRMCQYGAGHD